MYKLIFFGLTFIFIVLFTNCSSTKKIEALKPEPDDASPLVYDNPTSIINLPISMKLQDIENKTNNTLTGLIYEDNNIEDDNYTVKVWKTAPINLNNVDGKIQTVLPLKIIVNYRYGIEKFGISLFDTREFILNGKITLKSSVSFSNWRLNTNTKLESLDWVESPTVNIAGKQIAITYLINPAVKLFGSKIEKSIDDAIKKSADFKNNVLDALQKTCAPTLVNETYETWVRINPLTLYTTEATLKKENIVMQMGLKCNIETLIGKKPEAVFDKSKIVLQPAAKIPDNIDANIVAVSSYNDASRIITQNFKGKEFGSDSKKITVQKVDLWQKSGKIVIALEMTGSLNGTIYLTGIPMYNAETKEIYFDQLDYALDTKSALVKTANWLASGLILKKIEKSCRYSVKPNLDEGKQNMMKYMNNYSPMPGVFVNGTVSDIDFQKIQLTNKAIVVFLNFKGKVAITIDGIQ